MAGKVISLTDAERGTLMQAKSAASIRGIEYLSKLDFDYEAYVWQVLGSASNISKISVVSSLTADPNDPPASPKSTYTILSTSSANVGVDMLLSKIVAGLAATIEKNPHLERAGKFCGLGVPFMLQAIKHLLKSSNILQGLVPVWGLLQSVSGTIDRAVDLYSASNAMTRLDVLATNITSGIPSVAMGAFQTYLSGEAIKRAVLLSTGLIGNIASIAEQIATAGLSNISALVQKIVEAVGNAIMSLVEGKMFEAATKTCREYVKSNNLPAVPFAELCASSPFIGCVFFGLANLIGHFNLTTLLDDGRRVISSSSLTTSVAKVSETQRIACKYISSCGFKLKRDSSCPEAQAYILQMMSGIVSIRYHSHIITENASRSSKFKSWFGRKTGLYGPNDVRKFAFG